MKGKLLISATAYVVARVSEYRDAIKIQDPPVTCVPLRRDSFSSSNRSISWIMATSFSASCSTAARSQSSSHLSFVWPSMARTPINRSSSQLEGGVNNYIFLRRSGQYRLLCSDSPGLQRSPYRRHISGVRGFASSLGSDSRPVPRHTEQRIRDLCALAVTTPAEQIDGVLADLRSAIDEHVRMAREALGPQAANIAMLDSAMSESTSEEIL